MSAQMGKSGSENGPGAMSALELNRLQIRALGNIGNASVNGP